jgi:tetratricopeptide (TPR) repeat protein
MNHFQSALCLSVSRLVTRQERPEELWLDPFEASGTWAPPFWDLQRLGLTPREPVSVPKDGAWVTQPLRDEIDLAALGLAVSDLPENVNPELQTLLVRRIDAQRLVALRSLTHLIILSPINRETLRAIAELRNLRLLCVRSEDAGDDDVVHLRSLTHLEALSLDASPLTDRGVAELARLPLRMLALSDSRSFSGSGFAAFAGSRLEDLDLGFDPITDGAVDSISKITSLKHLRINGQRWETENAAEPLGRLTQLTSLGVEWARVRRLDWVSSLPNLRRLALCNLQTTPSLEPLSSLRSLEELSLSDVKVEDGQLKSLPPVKALDLKSSFVTGVGLPQSLIRLNLFNCLSVSEAGMREVAALPALEELNLRSCMYPYEEEQTSGLTDAAALQLAACATLRRLDLKQNRVSPSTILRLREALPPCRIEAALMVRNVVMDAFSKLETGQDAEAEKMFHSILKEDPSCAPAHLGLAKVHHSRRRFPEAIEAQTRALDIYPTAEDFAGRAHLYYEAGEWRKADEDLTRALKLDPRKIRNHLLRADVRLVLQNWKGALEDLDAYIRQADEAAWSEGGSYALAARGQAKLELGDAEGAVADCTLALGFDPDGTDALLYRAQAYEKLGRRTPAAADYARHLQLYPSSAQAKEGLNRTS